MITFNDPRIVFYFNMLLKYDFACAILVACTVSFVVPSLLAVGSSGFWDRQSSARNKSRSRFYLVVETRVFSAATCADDFACMR